MIERMVLQVLGIIIVGYYFSKAMRSQLKLSTRVIDSIVLGYATLIIPMTLVGYIFENSLGKYSFFYFGSSMILTLIWTVQFFIKRPKISLNFEEGLSKTLFKLNFVIIVGIGYLMIMLPERGWDAVNFYFPNALYFFLEDNIVPGINPISFYPTFKPPLNTLYLTYSFYVAQGMYANLHPFIFLLGTCILIYDICNKISKSQILPQVSILTFLTFGFTFFLIVEFAYYQELPIAFFSIATMNYLYKLKTEKTRGLIFLLNLSISLSILSKISGYAVLFLILISVTQTGLLRKIQLGSLSLLTLFLMRKAAFDIFIGTSIVVFVIFLMLFLHLYGSEEGSIELRYLFQTFLLPMFVGIGWLMFMLQIPNLDSFLISTYLENVQSTISFSYPSAVLPEQVVIEHGPQTSFLISLLFIFTGVSFSPHLLLFKIDGLRKLSSFGLIFRWFLGYMLLYFAYFSDVSARYLVPVMPILAIAIGISVNTFISRIQRNEVKKFIVLVLYGSGILFIAPLLPIRIHRDGITTFFFYFHQEFIVLIIYLVLMILLFHKVVSKMQIAQLKWVKIANSAFVIILLVPTIIAPVSVQTYAILTDTPEEELSSYYYRESFQEVVSYLNSIQLGLDELVLSAITPGLSYFLRHPVLDVHMISGVRAFSTDLKEMTTDEAINFVQQYKIRVIVQVANTSLSYGYYQQFYQEIALMQVVNTLPSTLVFFTQEYVVYQLME